MQLKKKNQLKRKLILCLRIQSIDLLLYLIDFACFCLFFFLFRTHQNEIRKIDLFFFFFIDHLRYSLITSK